MKLKRKDSQIDSKSFVSWVYAVFQQHCMQKEYCEAGQARLCADGDTWKQQNPDLW